MVSVGIECKLLDKDNNNPLKDCYKLIVDSGSDVFQVYLGDPNNTSIKQKFKFTNDGIKEFNKIIKKDKLIFIIHGSLTINIVAPINSNRFRWNFDNVIYDLNQSVLLNAYGVVIHMGSRSTKNFNFSEKEAIKNAIKGIKYILANSDKKSRLILETPAQSGSKIAYKIEDMAKIFKSVYKKYKDRVGICVDTQHIFTSGYNISEVDGVIKFFNLFNKLIGIKHICLFHINDSAVPYYSQVDRHDFIGEGYIFKDNFYPLAIICNIARVYKIPMILETHNIKNYKYEVTLLRRLSLFSSLEKDSKGILKGIVGGDKCNNEINLSEVDKKLCIKLFSELKGYHEILGNIHQLNVYSRIIRVLKYNKGISKIGDILELNMGIGKNTIMKICEVVFTKRIKVLDEMRSDKRIESMIDLERVMGIGPVLASKLVSEGIDTVDKLKRSDKKLSKMQEMGLKYYNKIDEDLSREEVEKFVKLLKGLSFLGKKEIYIAGSYRTGKDRIKDIDLIITKGEDIDSIIDGLIDGGYLLDYYKNSEDEFIGFFKSLDNRDKVYHVDFRVIGEDILPYYLLFFGSGVDFSTDIRHYAKLRGYKLNQYGIFSNKTGRKLKDKIRDEKDIFKFLGLKYVEPFARIRDYKLEKIIKK